jgi:hypothetical protein
VFVTVAFASVAWAAEPAGSAAPTEQRCGSQGVAAVVGIDYDRDRLGGVPGVAVEVDYPPSLSLSRSPGDHVTSLLKQDFQLRATAAANRSAVQIRVTSIEKPLPRAEVARVRFDCREGTGVRIGDLRCRVVSAVDDAGLPLHPKLAGKITCSVSRLESPTPSAPAGALAPPQANPRAARGSATRHQVSSESAS